jgi:hypothetical protein
METQGVAIARGLLRQEANYPMHAAFQILERNSVLMSKKE